MAKKQLGRLYIQNIIALKNKSYNQLEEKLNVIKRRRNVLKALPELFFLSQHKDAYVRQSVVEIVKRNIQDSNKGTQRSLLPLVLRGVGDPDCRYEALEGLIKFREKPYIFLIGSILLQDNSPIVRVQASDLLASLQQAEGIPFLEGSLDDKYALVRVYSAYGLALLDSKESIPKLIKLEKKDREITVKTACWGALFLLTGKRLWLEKMLRVLNHRNYHVPMQVINYISNAVDGGAISFMDVAPYIEQYSRNEKRKAVSSRMYEFLRRKK